MATRFLRIFNGPFIGTVQLYDRFDLLALKNLTTGTVCPHPVNIEKLVAIPEQKACGLQPPSDAVLEAP